MTARSERTWPRHLVSLVLLVVLVWVLVVFVPRSLSAVPAPDGGDTIPVGPIPTAAPQPPTFIAATIDGHDVRWWARRARRNGRHVRKLQSAIRDRLPIAGSGLATAFLCIHRFEGSWTDSGAPYWGGVQMDEEFMRTYGPEFYAAWGTADHWPAFVQVAVAMRANLSGRGFYPWPNSARFCGLL